MLSLTMCTLSSWPKEKGMGEQNMPIICSITNQEVGAGDEKTAILVQAEGSRQRTKTGVRTTGGCRSRHQGLDTTFATWEALFYY